MAGSHDTSLLRAETLRCRLGALWNVLCVGGSSTCLSLPANAGARSGQRSPASCVTRPRLWVLWPEEHVCHDCACVRPRWHRRPQRRCVPHIPREVPVLLHSYFMAFQCDVLTSGLQLRARRSSGHSLCLLRGGPSALRYQAGPRAFKETADEERLHSWRFSPTRGELQFAEACRSYAQITWPLAPRLPAMIHVRHGRQPVSRTPHRQGRLHHGS